MATQALVSTTRALDFGTKPILKIRLKDPARRGQSAFLVGDEVRLPDAMVLMESAHRAFILVSGCRISPTTVISNSHEECLLLFLDGEECVLIPLHLVTSIERTNLIVF